MKNNIILFFIGGINTIVFAFAPAYAWALAESWTDKAILFAIMTLVVTLLINVVLFLRHHYLQGAAWSHIVWALAGWIFFTALLYGVLNHWNFFRAYYTGENLNLAFTVFCTVINFFNVCFSFAVGKIFKMVTNKNGGM